MLILVVLVSIVAVLVTITDWRAGLLLVLLIGAVQDPFRKLTEGVPAYYVVWSAAIFGVVVLAAFAQNSLARFRYLSLGAPSVKLGWILVLLVVALQTIHSLLRWQNPVLPALGVVFYLAPVTALLVGIAYARNEKAIKRFLTTYVLILGPLALTVYLSLWYKDAYPVLRDVGTFSGQQIIIYDIGTAFESLPGTFRVGEIAAWHAATAAVFLIVLATQNRSFALRVVVAVAVVLLIGAIILTGRRKMLMALTIFLVVQWSILALFGRGAGRLTVTLLIFGVFGSFALTLLDPSSTQSIYVQRGATVFDEAIERFATALDLLRSAISRSDGLGLGVGVTSQGAQHVGGAVAAAGGAAEAGLGKIVVELGIPGALALLWLVGSLTIRLWRSMYLLAQAHEKLLFYGASFLAFLLANIATFTVATQVYGDPFVLIILGTVAGMLFSVIIAASQIVEQRKRQRLISRRVQAGLYEPPIRGVA